MDRVTKGERWSGWDTRRVGVNVVQKKGGGRGRGHGGVGGTQERRVGVNVVQKKGGGGGGMVEWVRQEEGGGECGAKERWGGGRVVQRKGGGGGMVEWVRHEKGGGECGAEKRGEGGGGSWWSGWDTRRVGVNVVQRKGVKGGGGGGMVEWVGHEEGGGECGAKERWGGGGMVEWVRQEEGGGECGAEERGEEGLGGEGREFVFMGFSF